MATVRHSNLTGVNAIHVPYAGQYATAAARETASDVSAADEGKLFRQLDDNSLWMLVSVSPLKWHTLGGGRLAGEIIIFYGTFGGSDGKRPIPLGASAAEEGWALCDGTNGTPDLSGRVVVGKGYAPGVMIGKYFEYNTTGGFHDSDLSGAYIEDTTLGEQQMPSHTHTVSCAQALYTNANTSNVRKEATSRTVTTSATGGDMPHTHAISTSATRVSLLQPYRVLAYIMKL